MARTKSLKEFQEHLPGEEYEPTPAQTELTPLARCYVQVRDERMAALKQEVELKGDLIKAMHRHELTEFDCDGRTLHLVPGKEKISVTPPPAEDDDDEQLSLEDGE